MKRKIDLLDEKSDFSKEILEKTPSWIVTWGNSIFFIFIIILFCLSCIVKYPDVVSAEVEITSENPPIYLIAKSNGKLNELDVEDGSSIKKGEWIAIIENSADTDDIKTIDSILSNNTSSSFSLPPNLKLGEIQSFYNDLIKNVNQYKYFKKFNPQMAGMSSNQDRINKVSNIQGNFNNQKEIAFKEYEVKKKDFIRNQELLNQGVISKSEFEKSQIELLQTENKYKSFNSNISNLESDKSIIRKDNVDLNLQKENQKIEYSTNVENAAQELRAQILTWKNKYLIQSPLSGKINFFDIWKNEQYVKNEQTLFSVIPINTDGKYFARVKMPIDKSGKVRIGQKVNVKLLNYPFEEYGVLEGNVAKITNVANESFYYVIVDLKKGLVTSYNKRINSNNLVGQADIITEDLTLIERFVYTLIRNFKQK